MALTRKFLSALGIEAEKIDEIIEAHTSTVNALKEERDKYKADAESLPGVQKELDELRKAAENDKGEAYKEQYEKLKKDYDDYKSGVEAREVRAKKQEAYKALLGEVGVSDKRQASIVKVTALDDLELDKDGKFKKADEIKESIKTEWADFIQTSGERGADVSNPPQKNNDKDKRVPSRARELAEKYRKNLYGATPKGEEK